MRKIQIVLILWVAGLACTACNLPQKATPAPSALPAATVLAATVTVSPIAARTGTPPAATRAAAPSAAPADPGDTVQAYLVAYPDDTAGMTACLSSSLRASLPAGGPGLLLQVEGDITGFVTQSGSELPNPPQAVVRADIVAGGARLTRTFNLVQENGKWVISSITS